MKDENVTRRRMDPHATRKQELVPPGENTFSPIFPQISEERGLILGPIIWEIAFSTAAVDCSIVAPEEKAEGPLK